MESASAIGTMPDAIPFEIRRASVHAQIATGAVRRGVRLERDPVSAGFFVGASGVMIGGMRMPCVPPLHLIGRMPIPLRRIGLPATDDACIVPPMREGDAHHLVRPDPARIIVPRRHGEVLVEPGLAAICGAVTVGGGFAGQVRWDDLAGMRAAARQAAAQQVRAFAERSGLAPPSGDMAARAWVVTGHQLEFYHAGVWAKVLATDALRAARGRWGSTCWWIMMWSMSWGLRCRANGRRLGAAERDVGGAAAGGGGWAGGTDARGV